MPQNFEESSTGSNESLPSYSDLFNAIGSKFVLADLDSGSDPANYYIETENDPVTDAPMGSILLAESYDHHALHAGELLRVSIPVRNINDIWGAMIALESDDNPDRYAIILHIRGNRSFAFKIPATGVIKPHRQLPKFGTHTRFVPRTYLEDTYRKIQNYQIVPIKPKKSPLA